MAAGWSRGSNRSVVRRIRVAIARFGLKEPLEPRRILVTGASGLLGRALLDRLRGSGESVAGPGSTAVARSRTAARRAGRVRRPWRSGRGRSRDRWRAARLSRRRHDARPGLGRLPSRHRVRHVQRRALVPETQRRAAGLRQFADGPRLRAPDAQRTVVDESAPLEPHPEKRGSYTRAKLLAERIVVDASRRRGLRAVVVRPGQIVGPGFESVSPYGTIALPGRWIGIGSGRMKLPLVHVNDVVDALVTAATRAEGGRFHLPPGGLDAGHATRLHLQVPGRGERRAPGELRATDRAPRRRRRFSISSADS